VTLDKISRLGGSSRRRKGDRVEREIVDRHKALGIHAERYPLSGASRFRGSAHDIDLYLFGRDECQFGVKELRHSAGLLVIYLPCTHRRKHRHALIRACHDLMRLA